MLCICSVGLVWSNCRTTMGQLCTFLSLPNFFVPHSFPYLFRGTRIEQIFSTGQKYSKFALQNKNITYLFQLIFIFPPSLLSLASSYSLYICSIFALLLIFPLFPCGSLYSLCICSIFALRSTFFCE